eukprot:CAMPEP_0113325988 /NCGR_PEP_ID=MMETSP0010_2-20120614/18195_1 /TAXON_ID=216773 ORGANISM="Corethron hystrix, Strain 308" /NCGR_SAMPLE_ID=MMETSP0010_2 /ASSEMBLY_ACC=CAM_ASM_000155 /LENGTH=131 /DNA_ID=CAMNT_0000186117 /DNA_START=17 /DNA_END=412 /DNA_ORIENTATION=- /assembly_acc=CAM_ASM_000155
MQVGLLDNTRFEPIVFQNFVPRMTPDVHGGNFVLLVETMGRGEDDPRMNQRSAASRPGKQLRHVGIPVDRGDRSADDGGGEDGIDASRARKRSLFRGKRGDVASVGEKYFFRGCRAAFLFDVSCADGDRLP